MQKLLLPAAQTLKIKKIILKVLVIKGHRYIIKKPPHFLRRSSAIGRLQWLTALYGNIGSNDIKNQLQKSPRI